MTREAYLADRAKLDELNKAIDDAPMNAKPVFKGICELHTRVMKYESKHGAGDRKNLSVQ